MYIREKDESKLRLLKEKEIAQHESIFKKNGANAHPTTPAAADDDDDDDDVLYLSLTVLTIKLTREYVYTYR